MQRREALRILDSWVTLILDQDVDRLQHVQLDRLMQGVVAADVTVLLRVRICVIVQQRLNHGLVL